MSISVVPYKSSNEDGWLYCRVLSFLKTAYFNDVLVVKPIYKNPSFELIAIDENQEVVGLIDIEIEPYPKELCSSGTVRSAMLHHIAVHPQHQRKNIGQMLLKIAEEKLKENGIKRLEAWTRDDQWVRDWYLKNNFKIFYSYLHVMVDGDQIILKEPLSKFSMVNGFAHYTGEEKEKVRNSFPKSYECVGFEKIIE